MPKLNSFERSIVVNEIYNKVSLPIIEKNKLLMEECTVPTDNFIIDCDKYEEIENIVSRLRVEQKELEKKWANSTFNEFLLSSYKPLQTKKSYITHRRKQLANIKHYPTLAEIEKEVVLCGNLQIPELIETIIFKLKNG